MLRIVLLSCLVGCTALSVANADLVMTFDPSQTFVVSNGSDQFVDVDLLVTYSGSGANTISAFELEVQDPDPGTALTIPGPVTSTLIWPLGLEVFDQTAGSSRYVIDGAGFANNPLPSDNVLATVRFRVQGSVASGSFPLDLTINSVGNGMSFPLTDITLQASAVDGTFTVSAVPEPSGFLFVCLACGVVCATRLLRRIT